jgi:multiple sugar transport system ATP-binding protein
MAKVAFHNVTKYFDEQNPALQQFNLTINDGEFVVLVGPSGCGKSTALRLLAGLETVNEGEILINDNVVNQSSPQQRNVAMVFQNYALYPHMTVHDNLAFPLKMAHSQAKMREAKVRQIAELLDLSELLTRKPKQLSGGQRQRVAMGRALVRDPSVFLLDEPLSNLDAKLRAQIRADIADLQQRLNKTTLYVTHDQVEAMTLGDRVAVMNQGEIQQLGTPEELYTYPHNVFVARFIGNPGMNIIPASLTQIDNHQVTIQIGQQTLILPSASDKAMLPYLDQNIFVGIRPEALQLTSMSQGVGLLLKVLSEEYLGHESLVYFQIPDRHQSDEVLIARLIGRFQASNAAQMRLYIDPANIYLFDNEGNYVKRN